MVAPPIRFDGRVAVVTGAGRGLGRAHALLLASRGAKLVVNNRVSREGGGDSAEATAAEIRARGGEAVAEASDVAAAGAAEAIVGRALERFGRLDALIHNAGSIEACPVAELAEADFRRVFEINTLSALRLTRVALPAMRRQRYGRLVYTTSSAGLWGNAGLAAYGMAKAALLALMRAVAAEEAPHGILANALCPSALTRMTEPFVPDALRSALAPERVAPAMAWLASERCDRSGLVLLAGGGLFQRALALRSVGVQFAPGREIAPEDVASSAEDIAGERGSREPGSANDHFEALIEEIRRASGE